MIMAMALICRRSKFQFIWCGPWLPIGGGEGETSRNTESTSIQPTDTSCSLQMFSYHQAYKAVLSLPMGVFEAMLLTSFASFEG